MTPDLPAPLDARLRHIQSEHVRVIETCQVASRATVRWGALMNESHRSLSRDYEVAGDAMDRLQAALSGSRGCYGARMTGGGFGGCVIALIERESVPSVQQGGEAYGDTQWIPCTPVQAPEFYEYLGKTLASLAPRMGHWSVPIPAPDLGVGRSLKVRQSTPLSTILAVICARGSRARPAAEIRTIKAPMPLIMTFPHWRWMPRATCPHWVYAVFWSGIRAITIRWRA